ncbi:MAG: Tetratricopeptide 2 repeat protein [Gemmatimonadales bacterium]|nr:Tetratricopeptide 2 repeat protein [Gemmatimonadales bacterium]
MNRSTTEAELVRVGDFELNVRTGELSPVGSASAPGGSAKVLLREQPFQILRILVERHGDIVTRQEIRQILWPDDTVVEFDRSINVAIAILRKALADDADHPKYIETLARRGYRLIAPVEWRQSSPANALPRSENQISEREPTGGKYSRKAALLGASAVVLVVVGGMSWQHFRDVTPPANRIMLAVLPFENLTGDSSQEYLADGLTEQTISQLGRLNPNQLGVIARTSVMGYKHKDERLDQVGRDLAVQYVLENSLRKSGGLLRITSQLIRVNDQSHLWSHDYDYRAQDVLTVQDELAKAVAKEIQVRLPVRQQRELAQPHPVNSEAFEAYLQGYYFWEKNTDQDTEMAGKYYERAIQLDSSYALAWAALSRLQKWQASRGLIPTEEGYRTARDEVTRALALNPNLAAAHLQMGRIQQQVDFDWTAADASFKRAVEIEPGNAEAMATAASSAKIFGRFDEALRLNRRATELDPLNAGGWDALAETEFLAGQLDKAAAHGKKALELNPDVWPGSILQSRIYIMQGRPQEALSESERVRDGATRTLLHAIAYFALGRKRDSDAALNELIAKYPRNTYHVATVYAFRNQSTEAFDWLDRAYVHRDDGLIELKTEPLLASLRHDPRYVALLKKLNFPN